MKKFWKKLLFLLLFVGMAFANTQGPNFPATVTGNTNTVGAGTRIWTNPGNISAADSVFATANFLAALAVSDDLNAQSFGFSIPAGATINGILLEVNYKCAASTATEHNVRLLKAGTATGTEKSTAAVLPLTATTVSYGGAADLWGATWTASDINASGFGAVTTYDNGSGGVETVSVDFFRITVTFTPATGCKSCFMPLLQSQAQARIRRIG